MTKQRWRAILIPSSLGAQAIIVTSGTVLVTLIGYATQLALAYLFGATGQTDAYIAASTIPTLLTTVFLGALRFTFIPSFIEQTHHAENEDWAWETASSVIGLSSGLFIIIAFIGIAISPQLIEITNPGFLDNSEQLFLTADLLRILWVSVIFSGTSAMFSSIWLANENFFFPTLATIVNSSVILVTTLALGRTIGIYSIAFGTLIGGIIKFILLSGPLIVRKRIRLLAFHLYFSEEVKKVYKLMIPLVLGALVYKSSPLVERFYASSLGEGSISYLGYGFKLISMITLFLSSGITTVLLPRISRYWASNDDSATSAQLLQTLRIYALISFPVIAIVLLSSHTIAKIFLGYGQFNNVAIINTSKAMAAYSFSIFALGAGGIATNILYAYKDTIGAAAIGIFGFILYSFLAWQLGLRFSYVGIAFAYSISTLVTLNVHLVRVWLILEKAPNLTSLYLFLGKLSGVIALGLMISWGVDEQLSSAVSSVYWLTMIKTTTFLICFGIISILLFRDEWTLILTNIFQQFKNVDLS